MKPTKSQWMPTWFVIVVASLAFATSGPLARYGRPADALALAFLRVTIAALILLLIHPKRHLDAIKRLPRRAQFGVMFSGVLLAAHFALFMIGLDQTSLPSAVMLVSLEPVSVVLCGWIYLHIRPKRQEFIGLFFALVGTLVMTLSSGAGEHRVTGDFLVLLSVAIYGLYVTSAQKYKDLVPARTYVASVYFAAALSLSFVMLIQPARLLSVFSHTQSMKSAILLAVIPTLVGHSLVQWAARVVRPAAVAMVSPGESVGSILIGVFFLNAIPTHWEWLGTAIILCSVLITLLRSPDTATLEKNIDEPS